MIASRGGARCGEKRKGLDARTEAGELGLEVLVPAVDEAHPVYGRRALRRKRRDEVAETGAQVGDDKVGGVQLARAGDDGGVGVAAPAEPARSAAEAVAVGLDGGAHLVE